MASSYMEVLRVVRLGGLMVDMDVDDKGVLVKPKRAGTLVEHHRLVVAWWSSGVVK